MFLEELAKAFLGNPSALCFQPATLLPSPNLPLRYMKEVRQFGNGEDCKAVNLADLIVQPRDFRTDGFDAVASAKGDGLYCRIGSQSTQ
jgi:hypothetical protein